VCFRGGALPSCNTFLITEVAYHLESDPPDGDLEPYLSWSYGLMVNVTGHDAIGVSALYSSLYNGPGSYGRSGWFLRYRRWLLQEGLALDLSVGRSSTADDDPEEHRYVADVSLNLGDYVGVFGHAFGAPDGAHPSWGVKLGSWPALVVGVGSFLLWVTIPAD
jgi:hypothetical protein